MWEWTSPEPEREVVVWDSSGYWARGLRRHLKAIIPVVCLPEFPAPGAWDENRQMARPPLVNVIVVRPSWDMTSWQSLSRLRQLATLSLVIAVVRRDDALGIVWSTLLGASAVFHDLGDTVRVARLIRRFQAIGARAELSLSESI